MKDYYNVKSYARTPEIQELPSLIDIQLKSFAAFIGKKATKKLYGGKLLEVFDEALIRNKDKLTELLDTTKALYRLELFESPGEAKSRKRDELLGKLDMSTDFYKAERLKLPGGIKKTERTKLMKLYEAVVSPYEAALREMLADIANFDEDKLFALLDGAKDLYSVELRHLDEDIRSRERDKLLKKSVMPKAHKTRYTARAGRLNLTGDIKDRDRGKLIELFKQAICPHEVKLLDIFGGKLLELFDEISPITSFNGNLSLYFPGKNCQSREFGLHYWFEEPQYAADDCLERDMSYEGRLKTLVALVNHEQGGEVLVQEIFLGEFPLITDKGTFIVNGTERVVVSQLIRSPGVYFDAEAERATGRLLSNAKLIPDRGAWMEFETRKTDYITLKFNRKRTIPVTILLRALAAVDDGLPKKDSPIKNGSNAELQRIFRDVDIDKVHPYIESSIKNEPDWDLKKGQKIAEVALIEFYRRMRPGDPPKLDNARDYLQSQLFDKRRYDLERVGRHKLNQRLGHGDNISTNHRTVAKADIVALVHEMIRINQLNQATYEGDNIDHLGNRRVKTVGELISNKLRIGLRRMDRLIRERMSIRDAEQMIPKVLVNVRPFSAAVREFFGSSQLSQFMEQTNPMSELTHKRTLSALGPGGLRRERAGFDVRDVHHSHYGRICPIETPEGPNIGLIGRLASYARVNDLGFIETPYRRVRHTMELDDPALIGRIAPDDIESMIIKIAIKERTVLDKQALSTLKDHASTLAEHIAELREQHKRRGALGTDPATAVKDSREYMAGQLRIIQSAAASAGEYGSAAGDLQAAAGAYVKALGRLSTALDKAAGTESADISSSLRGQLTRTLNQAHSDIENLQTALDSDALEQGAEKAAAAPAPKPAAEKNGAKKADAAAQPEAGFKPELIGAVLVEAATDKVKAGTVLDAEVLADLLKADIQAVTVQMNSRPQRSSLDPIGRKLRDEAEVIQEDILADEGDVIDAALVAKLKQHGIQAAAVPPFATDDITYLSADSEDPFTIAQANSRLDERSQFVSNRVSARYMQQFLTVRPGQIDYMDIAPRQIVGISAALIPFLSHDSANRALMGSNMQRQAVPLLTPDVSVVSTGMETQAASVSGQVLLADIEAEVISVQGHQVVVKTPAGEEQSYLLRKYDRSNQSTCIDQRPVVRKGDHIKPGDVIADSSSTQNGRLALGHDVLTCFLSWDGGNYEDALLISEDLLRNDKFTSIHIEKHEIEARDTKLGAEEITYDIPNVGEEALKDLDACGIVRIGAEVGPNDILVGKITPKGEKELSPEEKLLRAIFGEHAREVKDSSMRLPHGDRGKVVDVKIFTRSMVTTRAETLLYDNPTTNDKESKVLYSLPNNVTLPKLGRRGDWAEVEFGKKRGWVFLGNVREADMESIESMEDLDELAAVTTCTETLLYKSPTADPKNAGVMEVLPVNIALPHLKQQGDWVQVEHHCRTGWIFKGKVREANVDLPAGVEKMVRVSVAQRRKLTVGDKMAGRHGNKGVISKIVPIADMPYIEGGVPVEIILNPLGVPARMNIGQILELHLGWAADRLGFRAVTPVFDGAKEEEIQADLGRAWMIDWAWKYTTERAWENHARLAESAGMQLDEFDDDLHVICAYLIDKVGAEGRYDNNRIILERNETYVRRVAVAEALRDRGYDDPDEIMVYDNSDLSAEVRDRRDLKALRVSLELWIKQNAPEADLTAEMEIRDLFALAEQVMFETGSPVPHYGKQTVYDGRTGEAFDRHVAVGYVHMLKLAHLVEDKAHARSTGPYSLVTQQPLGGKAQFGGQRFGEMEVWALEAYGAAYILQEMLTVKSDDVQGRVKTYESIVKGEAIEEPGIPTSFRVLVKELQSLGLAVEAITGSGDVIRFGKDEEHSRRPQPATGLLGLGSR